ncbi:MAG: argininosuccinate lyase [Candidatus Omnitrophica bacterium]|nr:argininosuccinate lyase [Candidatus Omnitrophota bacterium]
MKKLWGGIFQKDPDVLTQEFTASLGFDRRLAPYDIAGSIAHVKTLYKAGILKRDERNRLVSALERLTVSLRRGTFQFHPECEDVHTAVEYALGKKVGTLAQKLHTGRSRNDQVVLDMRLYSKDAACALIGGVCGLQRSLIAVAQRYNDVIIPGYTHLRKAQPVLFAHYCLAYCEMLERDKARLNDALKRIDVLPMGSAALAGTSFALDSAYTARLLGFARVSANSIDAVSDRDFIIELLSALSITAMHLSRLSEDLILYSSEEFSLVSIDERFCTGSSIMPHKINPDTLELVRGSAPEVFGSLITVLALMKGLPLSYNRDLQNDKKALFYSCECVQTSLALCAKIVATLTVNKKRAGEMLADERLLATDIAEYLTKKGCPFREAHRVVGALFRELRTKRRTSLGSLSLKELRKFSRYFERDVFTLLDVKRSVSCKETASSTNPVRVKRALTRWKKALS